MPHSEFHTSNPEARIKLMLVEDNPEYRKVLETAILRDTKMELVSKAGTAERALNKLEHDANQPPPEIILLDLSLPGMSGLEAIPWFKKYAPHTKIIILTQSENEGDIFNAIKQGVAGYLLKSATIQQIKEGIQMVIDGGSPLTPSVAKHILDSFKNPKQKSVEEPPLTDRENEILYLLAQGLVKKEIADKLKISFFTVSSHVRHIYEKLEVPNAPAAVAKAYKTGLISDRN
jgi:DNA-binding NarL/FixJ family response regulator